MTLKEAFRYQNFLDNMLRTASTSGLRMNSIKVIKNHLVSKSDPDQEDRQEIVVSSKEYNVDDVVEFLAWLVSEKEKLSKAIGDAKASIGFDIDAALAANRFRHSVAGILKPLQERLPSESTEQGVGYKFNVEGNQTQYFYDIEVKYEDKFDRARAKEVMRDMITQADKVSIEIDSAMVNTNVDYNPVFDVNDTYDDVIDEFSKIIHS